MQEALLQQYLKSGEIVLDRFTVEHLLGKGAFGSVYLTHDSQTNQKCLLKIVPKSIDPIFVEYTKHLKELQKRLPDVFEHGIIVPTSIIETDEFVYQTFPYLGLGVRTFADILNEEGTVEPLRAFEVVRDIASALSLIHSQNIIHSDIKPSNILISVDKRVFLTDFGLAQRSDTEEYVVWIGTYQYAARHQE